MTSYSDDVVTTRPPLSRHAVVTAACDLIDQDGPEGLSFRKLGSILGVTAPALYAHVEDKNDLIEAIADVGYSRLVERYRLITETDPRELVRKQCIAYIGFATSNANLYPLMFRFRPDAINLPQIDNTLASASAAFEIGFSAIVSAIDAGVFHPDHDPLTAALATWTVSHGIAMVLLMGAIPDEASAARLQNTLIDSVLTGLSEPPVRH